MGLPELCYNIVISDLNEEKQWFMKKVTKLVNGQKQNPV
jgi:hypothetical protein